MPHWRIVRGHVTCIVALAFFAFSFIVPIALGAYLGVLVERQFGIHPIIIALLVFTVLFPVLFHVVASQLKGGVLGRALERFVDGSAT